MRIPQYRSCETHLPPCGHIGCTHGRALGARAASMDFTGGQNIGASSTPKIRTVGFNIEGGSPPADGALPVFNSGGGGRTTTALGSLSPVIIPGPLQV